MQHQGSQSEFLRACVRQAGHQARILAARTIGSALIAAGSFVAKQVLATVPAEEPAPPAPTEAASSAPPATGKQPNVKHAA